MLLLAAALSALRIRAYYPAACEDICFSIKGSITERVLCSFSDYSDKNAELIKRAVICEYGADGKTKRIYDETDELEDEYSDTAAINGISSFLALEAGKAVSECENEFELPLGNIFGSHVLSGKGPGIGLKIIPSGAAAYSVKSDFYGAGINQTHYRVSVTVTLEYRCVAPFRELSDKIELEYIISDTVIMGDIPEVLFFGGVS